MSPSALVLDAAAVERRLPGGAAVRAALRRAFAELAGGTASQPPQVQLCLPDGGGDVIVYPGTLSGPRVAGVKASPYLTARPVGERVTAWTLLLSTEDGHPVLLCDSARLTVERTAGTTAVAVDALAPADAGTLAVVGAGPVALAHLRHVGDVRAWRRVVVSSPALAAGTRRGWRPCGHCRSRSRSLPTRQRPSATPTSSACAPRRRSRWWTWPTPARTPS